MFSSRISHAELRAFAQSCRHTIIAATSAANSGHPGGSLSCVDFLSLLYLDEIGRTGEKIVVSNGHISPAVYSVLAGMGYVDREDVITGFRQADSIFEGHVTRHVPGVWFGTGPLGVGVSAACGFALSEKMKAAQAQSSHTTATPKNQPPHRVFALMGDGESQEGQVHEMRQFAATYKLDNLIVFCDYNQVQLTDSLHHIIHTPVASLFRAAGWNVITVDGHNFRAMRRAIKKASAPNGKPSIIIGKTIMGKGVSFMEYEGKAHRSTWHGKAASGDRAQEALQELTLSKKQQCTVDDIFHRKGSWGTLLTWKPAKNPSSPSPIAPLPATPVPTKGVRAGKPIVYDDDKKYDCRGAYGATLADLGRVNKHILAMTADVRGSVRTDIFAAAYPERHVDVGIAEQHLITMAGSLSLDGWIPFASTFGVFTTSRARDQARVNDINHTNTKLVSTHCGLSVGEDGPTHQAIDDMASMAALLHTPVIEPCDANQTDRIIRYVATHQGNFYVRMGRHKMPVITKENGSPFYDARYTYKHGRCDVIRTGSDVTIVAIGACVHEALAARNRLLATSSKISAEIVAVTSIADFDSTVMKSIRKTGRVVTVEDHNPDVGLGALLAVELLRSNIPVTSYTSLGVREYQLSGTQAELYDLAGISGKKIAAVCRKIQL